MFLYDTNLMQIDRSTVKSFYFAGMKFRAHDKKRKFARS